MTQDITLEMIKALSDEALASAKGMITTEESQRTEKRKQDAITRIKALAGANGFSVTINGRRGRPPKKPDQPSVKSAK
jgi:hypothetical protein